MFKAKIIGSAACSLAFVVGCGEKATNEPKKLADVVDEPVAERISPSAETAKESKPADAVQRDDDVKQAQQLQIVDEEKPADDATAEPATVPPVELSSEHAELVRLKVGDSLPDVELPQTDGASAKLSSLYGKAATVVVFWKGDRQMALDELADLGPDVVDKFGSRGVEVIGVAVNQPATDAQSTAEKAAAKFPQLVDADGKAFEQVGSEMLPWTFVLDADGKIVWFDLEYSLSTRRELQQALLATVR